MLPSADLFSSGGFGLYGAQHAGHVGSGGAKTVGVVISAAVAADSSMALRDALVGGSLAGGGGNATGPVVSLVGNASANCSGHPIWPGGPLTGRVIGDVRAWLIIYFGMPLILTGIVTSLLSLGMFHRDRLTPTTTRIMLTTSAGLDFCFLVAAILYLEVKMIFQVYLGPGTTLEAVYNWYLGAVTIIINYCEMMRNWITVLIGLERCVITCFPLHCKAWWSVTTTQVGIVVCALLAGLLRVPILVRRIAQDHQEDLWWRKVWSAAYRIHTVIDSTCLTLLPVLILAFCSFQILRVMHRSARLRAHHSQMGAITSKHVRLAQLRSMNQVRSKVHKVLMIVLGTFTFCSLPFLPLTFFQFYNEYQSAATNAANHDSCWAETVYKLLTPICWFCSLLNSTANFFVYIIHWNKYRQIIRSMLGCDNCSPDWCRQVSSMPVAGDSIGNIAADGGYNAVAAHAVVGVGKSNGRPALLGHRSGKARTSAMAAPVPSVGEVGGGTLLFACPVRRSPNSPLYVNGKTVLTVNRSWQPMTPLFSAPPPSRAGRGGGGVGGSGESGGGESSTGVEETFVYLTPAPSPALAGEVASHRNATTCPDDDDPKQDTPSRTNPLLADISAAMEDSPLVPRLT